MNILQISAPKSGSFWLHSILKQVLEKKKLPFKAFIKGQPEYKSAKDLQLSFAGQEEVDMIDIEEEGFFYRISSIIKEPITDLRKYADTSRLTWTHSTYCNNSKKLFELYDKKVCIIRDPRDRALSSAKFAFTPYMKKFYPSSYSSPEAFFEAEYGRLLEQWVWFVGNYLCRKEELDINFVFYERLLLDFENEFQNLLKYLNVELTLEERAGIEAAVSFSKMKTKSPGHLHKGKYGKWVDRLNFAEKELAVEKAGFLLDLLNYPLLSFPEEPKLPFVPSVIDKEKLQNRLGEIEWQGLYK